MSPLRSFMLNLLSSHTGCIQLVVDNAALATEQIPPSSRSIASRPNLPAPAPSGSGSASALAAMSVGVGVSNHSCSRWETDEPSPGRAPDQGAKTVASIGLSQHPRERGILSLVYKNSSPACPIRKLSPRVHPDENENQKHEGTGTSAGTYASGARTTTTTSPPSRPSTRMEGTSPMRNFDRLAISRPPLSPRKNTGTGMGSGTGGGSGRCNSTPGGNKAPAPKKKLSHTKPLRPPARVISKRTHTLAELQEEAPAAAAAAAADRSIAPSSSTVWAAKNTAAGPSRGLSKTLGTDVTEQAPVCPTRRPSTQSHEPEPNSDVTGSDTGTSSKGGDIVAAARRCPHVGLESPPRPHTHTRRPGSSHLTSTGTGTGRSMGCARATPSPTAFRGDRDILVIPIPPGGSAGNEESEEEPDPSWDQDRSCLYSKGPPPEKKARGKGTGTGGPSTSPIFRQRFTKRRYR